MPYFQAWLAWLATSCNIGISRELTYVGMSSKSALKDSEKEDIFGFVGAEMSKAAGARWG